MFIRRFPLMNAAGEGGGGGGGDGGQGGQGGDGGQGGQGGGGAAGGAAGGTPPAFDWNTGLTDEATKSWVTTKGYKDPAALAFAAMNQEKLLGVPADKIIKLPTDDKPESWKPVWSRLGVPETADGYKLPVPEGDKGEFAKQAAAWFHEANIPAAAAAKLAEKWNAFTADQAKAASDAAIAKGAEQHEALKKEWGAAYEQNLGIAKKAAAAFGWDQAKIDALQSALGYDGVMKFAHEIGTKVGEDGFVSGGGANPGGVMTPAQAQSEIALLRKDADFTARLLKGDAEAKRKWDGLHKMAYPGETVLT